MQRKLEAILMCLVLSGVPAQAADNFIVSATHTAEGLTKSELKAVFNGRKTVWADKSNIVVVVPKEGPSNAALMEFLGKSNDQFLVSWKKQMFSGNGIMPKLLADDAEVAAFVAKTPSAIGFIVSEPPAEVRLISKP